MGADSTHVEKSQFAALFAAALAATDVLESPLAPVVIETEDLETFEFDLEVIGEVLTELGLIEVIEEA